MKNKQLTKITLNIPEYIMKRIEQIDEEYPSTTRTGTILAILEKGLNWFAKQRKTLQSVKQGVSECDEHSTVGQQDNTTSEAERQENDAIIEKWLKEKEEQERINQERLKYALEKAKKEQQEQIKLMKERFKKQHPEYNEEEDKPF